MHARPAPGPAPFVTRWRSRARPGPDRRAPVARHARARRGSGTSTPSARAHRRRGTSARPCRPSRARASPRAASRGRRRPGSRGSRAGSARGSGARPRPPAGRHSSVGASSSINWVIRTPRSTVGSYSNVSWGVLFILSSRATRACSSPCAAVSPASVRSRLRSVPSTLTKTVAWRRSVEVSTPVTVTKPTRGSFNSPTASEITSRTASFTRRMRSLMHVLKRSVVQGDDVSLHADELESLAGEKSLGAVQQLVELPVPPRDAGEGDPRALPELVVVDLRDRRAETPLQLRLHREQLLALSLERAVLGEVQLGREDADVARAQLGRGGCRRRRLEVGALDLARLVDLEHIAFLHVVEALQEDAAFEAGLDLAGVFLEALQLRDPRLVDDGPVADDADAGVAPHGPARHVGAGDRAEPRHAEQLPHLDLAERVLHRDRSQHPDESLLDVLGQLVDDAVGSDLDALALRERPRLRVRPHVEADDHRVRGSREHDVVLGDPADALVDDVDADLRVLDLRELGNRGLHRPDDVALEHEVQVLDGAFLERLEERLERDPDSALRELLAPQPLAARLRVAARVALVLDDSRNLACGRRVVEAEDLDRIAGTGLLQLLAVEVVEGTDAAPRVPGDDGVADLQRAAMDEHRRSRTAADVEPRLDDRAGGLDLDIGGQLELGVGDQQDLLEQVVEPAAFLGGDLCELRRPAPLLGLQVLLSEVVARAVGVGVGQVDLVDGDDDRHFSCARVRDRLARLRHHAVVRGHDEHRDVGHLRAAGAHGGERLVARRVEERQLPAVVLDLVRADVLGDPAGFGLDDGGLADRVEQRRLAVVDMAHDRDDRRTGLEIGLVVLVDLGLELLVGRVLDRDLAPDLGADQLQLLVRERLRGRLRRPEDHQELDDLGHRLAEGLREVLDGDAGLDRDRTGRLDDLARLLGPLLGSALAGLAAVLAGTRGTGVDDDAALAAPWRRPLAGPDGAVGPFRTVSHRRQCRSGRVRDRPGRSSSGFG